MRKLMLALSAAILFSSIQGLAQNSRVQWYVFNGGFGFPASNFSKAKSSVGQPFIGITRQANNQIVSGFLADTLLRGTVVSVAEPGPIPLTYALLQNYPNPFNPVTTIRFTIPEKTHVSLRIYDILGREVALLVNEEKNPGAYDVRFNANQLSSGAYFYSLHAGSFHQLKKLMVLK